MPKINGSNLFGGNPWSKILGFLSFLFLCLAGITSISKIDTVDLVSKKIISSETPWKIAILWFAFSIVTGYISYHIAGGRRNPAIGGARYPIPTGPDDIASIKRFSDWKEKDLYDLIKHVSTSGQAKIGFHSLRDQSLLLSKLESIGIKKKPSEETRQFIRDKIVMDRRAFDICRDNI